MLTSPGIEVNQLHDKFYRKYEVYSMAWGVDLSQMKIAGAPSGGPVAMVRDSSQILRATADTRERIQIYTSSGSLISSLAWEHSSKLKHMGWTEKEELVCVATDGRTLMFNVFGEKVNDFKFAAVSTLHQIVPVKPFVNAFFLEGRWWSY
jgi:hypothetical protein